MTIINRVANEWLDAPHRPYGASYSCFASEVVSQFSRLPVEVRWISGTLTGTSDDLFTDCENGVLTIAVDGSPLGVDHPLAREVNGVSINSMFRACHDYYGHFRTRSPFETFEGELRAYEAHKRMFSPEAQAALYSETIAQLCYHSAFGEFVPEQKCVFLPIRF
jgi:hypothetical protein